MASNKPVPIGKEGPCGSLWNFCVELRPIQDLLDYKRGLLEEFYPAFTASLKDIMQQIMTPEEAAHYSLVPIPTGSVINHTDIEESDIDVILALKYDDRSFSHITQQETVTWSIPDSTRSEVDYAIRQQLQKCIHLAATTFAQTRPQLGWKLKKETTKADRCVYAWKKDFFEFDLLVALHGLACYGTIGTENIGISDNPLAATKLAGIHTRFPYCLDLIRLFKWLGYRWKKNHANYDFPSCGFESIFLEKLGKYPPEWKVPPGNGTQHFWANQKSFKFFFDDVLTTLGAHLEANGKPLRPPNVLGAEDDIIQRFRDNQDKLDALQEFIKYWKGVELKDLLSKFHEALAQLDELA